MSASKSQEIEVGQEWKEDKYAQRLMRVTELHAGAVRTWSQDPDRVTLAMIKGVGRPFAEMKDYTLRSGWTLVKEASKTPPRRIALVIAPATATHCCPNSELMEGCPKLDAENQSIRCNEYHEFQKIEPDGMPLRLPECIAAEVK